jgi:hypothetical protein
MSNFTAYRPGQINAAGATDALFLKLYSGEVLTTFSNANVMLPLTRVRTIKAGKSAQFPVTGVVSGGYHQPGVELVGQVTKQNEKIINIDDLLVSDVFLDTLEEVKNHYDIRSIYSREQGIFLANQMDKKLIQTVILAARSVSNLSGIGSGGMASVATNIATSVSVLKASLRLAAQTFDEKNVPDAGRVALLRPAQYHLLLTDSEVTNNQYDTGGSSKNETVSRFAGLDLKMTNQIPNGVVGANTGENNTYSGTFTTTSVVCFQKEAVGSVQMVGLATEMDYIIEKQGWMIIAKYAMGHGILRPECAVEFTTA